MNLAFESATTLAAKIQSREISCQELLEYFINRLDIHNPEINAVIVRDLEVARSRALEADRVLAKNQRTGPLHGVPMTIKESFNLTGTPTTFGFPEFRDNIADANAVAVDRLLDSGAIIFGKTNVPPGLMDGQSWNEIYGRTNNPWDLARTPGGSSGGAAAALASGMTGLELGSDVASSIRNPAHYCGVYGHKPTYALCPQRGHSLIDTLQSMDIAVVGPMARSVADLKLALSIIAGPEGIEGGIYSVSLPQPRLESLRNFRVALVLDDDFAEVDLSVQDQLVKLGSFLERGGVEIAQGVRPGFNSKEFYILYMILLRAAGSVSASDEQYAGDQERARGADRTTRDIAAVNAYGATLTHRDWLKFDEERLRLRRQWQGFFEEFDVLLCPPLSTAAFPHSTIPPQERTLMVNNHEVPFENQLFWAGYAGLAYLPATVAPIGLTPEGLPVGVQIIGPPYGDLTCLLFAQFLEENYYNFVPPPHFKD